MKREMNKVITGYVRQDNAGQYVTNGNDCYQDGKDKWRLCNGDFVTIVVHKDICPTCERPY